MKPVLHGFRLVGLIIFAISAVTYGVTLEVDNQDYYELNSSCQITDRSNLNSTKINLFDSEGSLRLHIDLATLNIYYVDSYGEVMIPKPKVRKESACDLTVLKAQFENKKLSSLDVTLSCRFLYNRDYSSGFTHIKISPQTPIRCKFSF